jgi:hypothetical protein
VHAPSERVRHAPDLLGHQDLLQHRVPTAAEILRQVHPGEAELHRKLLVAPLVLGRDLAGVLLGVLFPRDQLVVDEAAGAILDLTVFG